MGLSRFTSHPKEGVLRLFVALKNSSPWPGSKPQPLGTVESTLACKWADSPTMDCPDVFGELLILFNCSVGVEINIHLE
jgi:hypothetical protein